MTEQQIRARLQELTRQWESVSQIYGHRTMFVSDRATARRSRIRAEHTALTNKLKELTDAR